MFGGWWWIWTNTKFILQEVKKENNSTELNILPIPSTPPPLPSLPPLYSLLSCYLTNTNLPAEQSLITVST